MRIVYLAPSDIPSRGADSIQVMRMCEAFGKNGQNTSLIAKQTQAGCGTNVYEFYGIEQTFQLILIPCRKGKGVGIRILPKIYARLRQYDPKEVLIYARDIYGVSLAIRMGFRVIYEAHAAPYNRLIRYLETGLLKHPGLLRLVVISEGLRKLYLSRFDIAHKTVVCHDAANVPKGSSKRHLYWPPCRDTLQIGYTGHLYPGRGIDIIVECAKRLPTYDFHIVGGTDADIAFWKIRTPPNLHFHGFLRPALADYARARCDVLLMPYQKAIINPHSNLNTTPWMSPMKLFEYMASRKTIIASDLPVLREVLDERMAVLLPPDETDEWVKAIRWCEDKRFRNTLAENAYNAFLKNHTWVKRAQKVLEGIGV